jgi:hypothetical protein
MKETMLGISKSSRPERRQSSARPASLAAFAEATGLAAGAAAVAVAAVAAAAAAIECSIDPARNGAAAAEDSEVTPNHLAAAADAAAVAVAAVAAAAAAIEFFYPSSPARAPLRPRSLAAAAAAVPPACSCLTCVFLSAM